MAITYRTVIDKAITDFNSIQDVLSVHKAKYGNQEITLTTVENRVLVPTESLSGIISSQLQLIPTALYTATGAVSGQDITKYGKLTIGTAEMGTLTSAEQTDGSLKISSSVTSAGWIASDPRTFIVSKAEFTIDGGTVKSSKAGYIKASETLGTIGAGSVSSSAAITATTLTAGQNGITFVEAPTGTAESDYFTLKPYATASSSMTLVAGYITQKGTEGTAASTNKKTYYIAKATGSVNSPAFSIDPVFKNAGENATSGNVTLAASDGTAIVDTKPTSGFYAAIKNDAASSENTITATATEGYTKGGTIATGKASYNLNSKTYYVKLKSGSVDLAASQTIAVDPTVSVSGKTLTISGSKDQALNIKRVEGYVSTTSGTASSTKAKASVSKTVDLTTLDSQLLASNIRSGATIFGIVGTYLAPSFDNDAGGNVEGSAELRYVAVLTDDGHGGKETHYHSEHMLNGAVAYIDNKPVYGIMNDYSVENNSTAKNVYGASGSGTLVATTGINLSGATLTAKLNSTGYIKAGISNISLTVPTEKKTVNASNQDQTVTPTSGALLSEVTVKALASAEFSGASLTPTATKSEAAITGATNIQSVVELNPPTARDYMIRLNLTGSATPKTSTSGYTAAGENNGTVSIASGSKVDIRIPNTGIKDGYFVTSGMTDYAVNTTAGYLDGVRYLIAGNVSQISGQTLSITANSTSPTASGNAAKIDSAASTYVTVAAKGSTGSANVTKGWVGSDTAISAKDLNASARIAAVINPSVTNGAPVVTAEVSGYTTYSDTGAIASKISASTQSAEIPAVNVLNASTEYKDKYVVGTFTAKTNKGTATISIGKDVTGAYVDESVESLYKRLLGQEYTPVRDEFQN